MTACSPSGDPSPPTISPQPQPAEEQIIRIRLQEITLSQGANGTITMTGSPRATDAKDAPTGIARVMNVDGAGSLVVAHFHPNGGFSVTIAGTLADALRIDVRTDHGRAYPVDAIGDGQGGLAPRVDCFSAPSYLATSGWTYGVPSPIEINLKNACPNDLTVGQIVIVGDRTIDPASASRPIVRAGNTASASMSLTDEEPGGFVTGVVFRDTSGAHRAVITLEGAAQK